MILENKPIPQVIQQSPNYTKMLYKIIDKNKLNSKILSNTIDNAKHDEYNKRLKINLSNLLSRYKKNTIFDLDNDLKTMKEYKTRNKINDFSSIKSLDEEFKEIIKKQNTKILIKKPDALKENYSCILKYRKNIALRFKFDKIAKLKKSKSNLELNNKNDIYNVGPLSNKHYNHSTKKKLNELFNKQKYIDKFLITGLNNNKFQPEIIKEENS